MANTTAHRCTQITILLIYRHITINKMCANPVFLCAKYLFCVQNRFLCAKCVQICAGCVQSILFLIKTYIIHYQLFINMCAFVCICVHRFYRVGARARHFQGVKKRPASHWSAPLILSVLITIKSKRSLDSACRIPPVFPPP